jgi:dGTPase
VSQSTEPNLIFDREAVLLAPYAMRSADSAGRKHAERPQSYRGPFQRDRDRVIHCSAFRRLSHKTQVFTGDMGDYHRTRLTHTLEVASIARTLARALRLNEDLVEALSLAHDIGHPPFGHRGEVALDELMQPHGGFRHNAQVLRVVDLLERRSPDYPGLNLTRELRESLLKHEDDADWPAELEPRPRRPYLEAQVVDLADSTAYDVHDIEDGLNAGMFAEADLERDSALWRAARASIERRYPRFLEDTDDRKLRVRTVANQVLKTSLNDLIASTQSRIAEAGLTSADDARRADRLLVGHGPEVGPMAAELQQFLYRRFYRHAHLMELSEHARRVLGALFPVYVARPAEMAHWYRAWADEVGVERAVCDYLAGMTDRFAEQEHARLVGGA